MFLERDCCPVVRLALRLHNQAVIAEAESSRLNRYVVQRDNGLSDEGLKDPDGRRKLVVNHVTHGGVGPFPLGAVKFLQERGVKVESQMIPV